MGEIFPKLGWITVGLSLLGGALYIARKGYIYLKKNNKIPISYEKQIKQIMQLLAKYHKYIGSSAVIIGFIHGYFLLGGIRLHTGFISWGFLAFLMVTGLIGPKYYKKSWRKIHKGVAIIFAVTVFVHLFFRNLFL